MEIQRLVQTIKSEMQQEFGSRLRGVVLFGSHARGDASAQSDVDILVLLAGRVSLDEDLGRVVKRTYPLTLADPEHPIHAIPVDYDKYQKADSALYRLVKREGIAA